MVDVSEYYSYFDSNVFSYSNICLTHSFDIFRTSVISEIITLTGMMSIFVVSTATFQLSAPVNNY